MIDKDGEAFIELLRGLREGRAANEAGRKMAELVFAVTETYGSGYVTIKFKVAMQKDSSEVVETIDEVVGRIPEERRDAWFFGPDGRLSHTKHLPRADDPPLFDPDAPDSAGPDDPT